MEIRNIDLAANTKRRTTQHVISKYKRMLGRSIDEQSVAVNTRREADSVAYAMQEIKQQYGPGVQAIAADNGSEFTTLTEVMDDIAPVYFVHPYTSSERGTDEVHNRMIR